MNIANLLRRAAADHGGQVALHQEDEIVDALPRTGSGKLNRPELHTLFP